MNVTRSIIYITV